MKPETPKQAGFRKFLGILLLALGGLGTVSLLVKEIPLALFGRHTTGLVTKVEIITTSTSSRWVHGRKESRSGSTTRMDLAFTTKEDQPLTVRTTATFRTAARVGDQHPMVYLPWRPGNAKIYGGGGGGGRSGGVSKQKRQLPQEAILLKPGVPGLGPIFAPNFQRTADTTRDEGAAHPPPLSSHDAMHNSMRYFKFLHHFTR